MTARYLITSVFALVLSFSGLLGATEVAPLIGESTILVGHLDLRRLDLDRLQAMFVDSQTTEAKRWGYDEASITRIMGEMKVVLDQFRPLVQGVLDTITEELGIKDVYLIGNFCEVPFFLATPIDGKTAQQKEKLAAYLLMAPDFEFELMEHAGFLVAVPLGNKDRTEEYLKSFEPVEKPMLTEALKDRENDLLKFGLVIPPQLFDLIAEMPQNDVPQEVLNAVSFIAQKAQWISAGGDLHVPSFQLTIKTPKTRDARQLRNLLEGLIEMGGTAISGIASSMGDDPDIAPFIDYIPLAVELGKGGLRMLLPTLDGDRLVYRIDSEMKLGAVAVGGIGIALLLPAVQAAREAARRMQCVNNIKQIMFGFHNYHDTYAKLPPAYTVDKAGKPLHSWRVLLLPFLEQAELYGKIRLDEPWDSEHNKQFHDVDLPMFRCPSNAVKMKGQCDYSVIVGEETVFDGKSNSFARIKDGTSNTICVVERRKSVCWMDPTQEITFEDAVKGIASASPNRKSAAVIGSLHPGGANFGFWDGSVRFLSETIDLDTFEALLGCNDGISVHLD